MYKKIVSILLCVMLLCGLSGCKGKTKDGSTTKNSGDTPSSTEDANEDAELLEMIRDDLTVVSEAELSGIIADMKAQPSLYYGKIYQLEGICQNTDKDVYIVANPEEEGLKLNYLTQEFEDGAKIKVIGVLNEGSADNGEEVVFDTVLAQSAD